MDVDTLPHPPTLAPAPVATSPTVHRKADPLAGQVLADGLRGSAPSDPLVSNESIQPAPQPRERFPHQKRMERAFNTSFEDIKVVTGDRSVRDQLGAEGIAQGNTIRLADTHPNAETVAHELTHVQQQRGQSNPAIAPAKLDTGDNTSPQEREAEQASKIAATGSSVHVRQHDAQPIARRMSSKKKIKKYLKYALRLCKYALKLVKKKKWDLAKQVLQKAKEVLYKIADKFKPALVIVGLIDLAQKAIDLASKIPFTPVDAVVWALERVLEAIEREVDRL